MRCICGGFPMLFSSKTLDSTDYYVICSRCKKGTGIRFTEEDSALEDWDQWIREKQKEAE